MHDYLGKLIVSYKVKHAFSSHEASLLLGVHPGKEQVFLQVIRPGIVIVTLFIMCKGRAIKLSTNGTIYPKVYGILYAKEDGSEGKRNALHKPTILHK